MNAEDHETARNIARLLDQGTRTLPPQTAAKLAAAREQALARFQPAPELRPAWAGHRSRMADQPLSGLRYALPIAVLVLGMIGVVYWQLGNGNGNELADIDARLLTDDLPIDAYLDKGFDSWLKRQSR